MPHDKNGQLLKSGDRVLMEFVVGNLYQTENGEHCNCDLDSVEKMPGNDAVTHIVANARMVTKKS